MHAEDCRIRSAKEGPMACMSGQKCSLKNYGYERLCLHMKSASPICFALSFLKMELISILRSSSLCFV